MIPSVNAYASLSRLENGLSELIGSPFACLQAMGSINVRTGRPKFDIACFTATSLTAAGRI